jgi:hypothetical protein
MSAVAICSRGALNRFAVSPEEWGLALSRYVHLNPVRVGRLGLNKSQQQRMRTGAGGVSAFSAPFL